MCTEFEADIEDLDEILDAVEDAEEASESEPTEKPLSDIHSNQEYFATFPQDENGYYDDMWEMMNEGEIDYPEDF